MRKVWNLRMERFSGREDSDERLRNKICLLRGKGLSKNEDLSTEEEILKCQFCGVNLRIFCYKILHSSSRPSVKNILL